MKLPKFDSLGNLPERIYPCNKEMIHAFLVAPFPSSLERQAIYDGFCLLHSTVESLGVNAIQWIDGSFTTRKLDPADLSVELEPGDVDIVTFIDYNTLNALLPIDQQRIANLLNAHEGTKAKYRTHTFLVAACGYGHPYYNIFERQRAYFRDIFSRHSPPSTRQIGELEQPYPEDAPRKGVLSITIGNPMLVPHVKEARK
ncbi:MAG: hypothetical protein ABIY70_15070 [Capsulimonas sp.]|uniref:DUF6932 family protein n=1 Tax=Capsulimonas sp. TaxID=2494211 RepID=UPI003267C46C